MSDQAQTMRGAGEALEVCDEISVLTKGYSMYPLFRPHKDVVIVKRVDSKLEKGDVVLYPGKDGEFILHRIMRIKRDYFIIRGDNNYFTEQVDKNKIVGILKEFYRDGKYINCSKNFKYKLYTFYICHSYWLRILWKRCCLPFLVKVKHFLFRRKGK